MSSRKKRAAHRKLTAQHVRELALSFPETHESAHMQHPDFRVRNKIFATLTGDELRVNVKIDPANLDALVRSHPGVYQDVWAGRWIGMEITAIDADHLHGLLEDAWLLTAPKTLAQAYRLSQTD